MITSPLFFTGESDSTGEISEGRNIPRYCVPDTDSKASPVPGRTEQGNVVGVHPIPSNDETLLGLRPVIRNNSFTIHTYLSYILIKIKFSLRKKVDVYKTKSHTYILIIHTYLIYLINQSINQSYRVGKEEGVFYGIG